MKHGIMLKSTTVDETYFYLHVPKGYNRWTVNINLAHRFASKEDAEKLALELFDKYEDKGIIVVTELDDLPAPHPV